MDLNSVPAEPYDIFSMSEFANTNIQFADTNI